MAYRAYIVAVAENPTPTDSIIVTVKYEDAVSNRTIIKPLKYVVGTTRAEFEALVLAERNALRNLDAAKAVLEGAIGQEVT